MVRSVFCSGMSLIVLLTLSACVVKSDAKQRQAQGEAADNKKACLAIVGGDATPDYPAVYMITTVWPNSNNAREECTGTFVGDNVMITASHCIPSTGVRDLVVVGSGAQVDPTAAAVAKGLRPTAFFLDPTRKATSSQRMEDSSDGDSRDATDVAILLFPANSSTSQMILAADHLADNTKVSMVGYGLGDLSKRDPGTAALKRYGQNTILPSNPNFTYKNMYQIAGWSRAGEAAQHGVHTAISASGDSGGPIFVDNKLYGTVVGGYSAQQDDSIVSAIGSSGLSIYVDSSAPTVRALVQRATAAGAHFNTAESLAAAAATAKAAAAAAVAAKAPAAASAANPVAAATTPSALPASATVQPPCS